MNFKEKQKILILAPHTDDGEFGCGGTINKFIKEGHEVFYAAFSPCRTSVREGLPPDILISEVKAATKVLGIKPENLLLFDYEVRKFNYQRQEILEDLIKLRQSVKPDLIFMPTLEDMHQDHSTLAQEGLRAFKFSSILSYEMPWNNLNFSTTCFIHLTVENIETKIKALEEYKSQSHRPYANGEFLKSWARTRGVQISSEFAETFQVLRWVIS